MNQKNTIVLVLGLTLALVAALTLAPILNDEMAFAGGGSVNGARGGNGQSGGNGGGGHGGAGGAGGHITTTSTGRGGGDGPQR